ncbi:MAG: hypothetical protein AAF384_07695 [Pseudomonadota bacterium]
MRSIARFAMRGPQYAVLTASGFLLGSLKVLLLLIPSGGILSLTTMRHGGLEGLKLMVMASIVCGLFAELAFSRGLPVVALCTASMLPPWIMALKLKRSEDPGRAVSVSAYLVAAYAITVRLNVEDVGAFWLARLEPIFDFAAQQTGQPFPQDQVLIIANSVHGWLLAMMCLVFTSMLFLGRWWQSSLYNPGGFGNEFRGFRVPHGVQYAALALAVIYLALRTTNSPGLQLLGDFAVILAFLYALQGLAVVHSRAKQISLARGWLTGLYVMLVIAPYPAAAILVFTGLADNVFDFRGRRKIESKL